MAAAVPSFLGLASAVIKLIIVHALIQVHHLLSANALLLLDRVAPFLGRAASVPSCSIL